MILTSVICRHGQEEAGIAESLEQLGLDYIDLYLIHWPVSGYGGQVVFDHVKVKLNLRKCRKISTNS
jgi:diketogulonate reductase-like aldo/keto reductase